MNWYLEVLRKYADFEGRARRTEYWMYALINFLIMIALVAVESISGLTRATNGVGVLSNLYALAVLIPGIAVTARRLHDINKSGFAMLIALIPCIGGLILLLWMVKEGDRGSNDYGPDPKALERKAAQLE